MFRFEFKLIFIDIGKFDLMLSRIRASSNLDMELLLLVYYKIVHVVQNNEKIHETIKNKGNMQ